MSRCRNSFLVIAVPLITLAVTAGGCHTGALPDRSCTPGDAYNGVTAAEVCTPGWAGRHRAVSSRKRDAVWRRYGFDPRHHPRGYEVDHLVSLELGGDNSVRNLFPQPPPYWRQKDRVENRLHAEVCSGRRELRSAQRAIARNWLALYRREF